MALHHARIAAAVAGATLLALAGLGSPTAAQEDASPIATVKGMSEPIYEDSVTEVYEVPTPHGTLYGEVVRPVVPEGTLVPVILTYSPYNVLGQALNAGAIAADDVSAYFVPRGYARAVFDVVGTRNSGGCYDYGGIGERETGRDLVDFLGSQPWSNGRVGMIGGSYDGTTQWAAAIEQPEHLATIIPQVAIDRWYDYAYGGGIRYFLNSEDPADEGFDTPLAFDFGFGFLPPSDPAGASPTLFAEALQGRINPCQRIEHTERGYEYDPVYDAFWEERDYRSQADRITATVLVEGGWLDHNVKHWDSTRMFMALPDDLPKRLVMGQWQHSANQFEDALDLRHAWFDRWLLDLPTGVEDLPAVDSEPGGVGERTQSESWPPPETEIAAMGLTAPVAEGEEPGVGELALVGADEPSWSAGDPPATEQELLSGRSSQRGTYVHFVSAPLAAEVRVSGNPVADLEVTSTADSAHFTPVLYEELPDGTINVITRGFLNGRNRNGLHVSEPLPVGEPYRAPVDMWDVDYVVAAGNRLGLVLASDNSEWALPDDDTQGTQTLTLGGASRLSLPVSTGKETVGVAAAPPVPSETPSPPQPSPPSTPPLVERLAGPGRVETAVAVSSSAFDSAERVVIATAEAYPDALAGAPLAVQLDAPLLLSGSADLSAATAQEIQRLGAREAVLLGGPAALSPEVEDDLRRARIGVRRVSGSDRFATAAAVAAELATSGEVVEPIVVEGANASPSRGWPDAVSAAPLAAHTGQPVLLVTRDAVPPATRAALDDLQVDRVLVVGGPAAVSDEVAADLRASGFEPRRVAGETRYATSAAVADEMVAAGMDAAQVWLATGRDWPDALTGGAAVGRLAHTLLLVDGMDLDASPETRDRLAASATEMAGVRLLGGTAAISATVEDEIRELVGDS